VGNKRRNFKFYDDGKDRGETWRHPIIKLQTGTGQLNAKFDEWYAENRHLEFDEAEKIWIKRLSDADLKPPGVPSDLLNYRYTGDFPSPEAERSDLVSAKRRIDRPIVEQATKLAAMWGAKLTGAERADAAANVDADTEAADDRAADRIVKHHQPLVLKIVFGDRKSKDPKKRKRFYDVKQDGKRQKDWRAHQRRPQ
jgi:hypothetical protein